MWHLAWRLLGRELRSGELRLLFLALALAVAAVTAVGFFADRVRLALEREAQQLMGGDLVLIADHPWSPELALEAKRRGLQVAETLSFPSMVMGREQPQLADVKAVSSGYPLRGKLSATTRQNAPGLPVNLGPQPGTVWLDERLSGALAAEPGSKVSVGQKTLPVAAILTLEPDRGINFFALAPRLMMHLDDIPGSGLVQAGSRVTYRLLLAGEIDAVAGFRTWLGGRLQRGERMEDASNARPEIRNALDRAQRFLGLATLLTVILSAVAAALAARRYMQRHLDACAVMRCLGVTQGAGSSACAAFSLSRQFVGGNWRPAWFWRALCLDLLAVEITCPAIAAAGMAAATSGSGRRAAAALRLCFPTLAAIEQGAYLARIAAGTWCPASLAARWLLSWLADAGWIDSVGSRRFATGRTGRRWLCPGRAGLLGAGAPGGHFCGGYQTTRWLRLASGAGQSWAPFGFQYLADCRARHWSDGHAAADCHPG